MTDKSFLAGFFYLEFPLYAHVILNSDLHSITFLFKMQKQECFVECFSDREAVLCAGETNPRTPRSGRSDLTAACGLWTSRGQVYTFPSGRHLITQCLLSGVRS